MAKEIVEANWDEMKAMATSASLNARHRLFTETLVEMLESNDSIESFSVSDFVELIILAIPRYSDKQSRSLLLNGIKSVYRAHASAGEKNEKLIAAALIKMLLSQLRVESSVWMGMCASLLAIACLIVQQLQVNSGDNSLTTSKHWKNTSLQALIKCQAKLIEVCADMDQSKRRSKRRLKAIEAIFLDSLCSSSAISDAYVEIILKSSDYENSSLIPLLGILYKSLREIKKKSLSREFLQFYYKQAIRARLQQSTKPRCLLLYSSVFTNMTEQDYKEIIFQSADKVLLQNPEVSLTALTVAVESAPHFINQFEYFQLIYAQLLNLLRSANAQLRQDALRLWKALLDKSNDMNVSDSILGAIQKCVADKFASPESKISVYLAASHLTAATELTSVFIPTLSAESNDNVIKCGLEALLAVINKSSKATDYFDRLQDFCQKGIQSTKESTRLNYLTFISRLTPGFKKFAAPQIKQLISSKCTGLMESFMSSAILMDLTGDMTLISALLSDKLLSKLSQIMMNDSREEEEEFVSNCLYGWRVITNNNLLSEEYLSKYVNALKSVALECRIDRCRREAVDILRLGLMRKYENDRFAIALIKSISNETRLKQITETRLKQIFPLLTIFSDNNSDTNVKEHRLLSCLKVLSKYHLEWAKLVEKVFPNLTAQQFCQQNVNKIINDLINDANIGELELCGVEMLIILTGDLFLPVLLEKCQEIFIYDLPLPLDVKIWRTPEGPLPVQDVLTSSNPNSATDKWEQELRRELELKKRQQSNIRLSKQEQAIVDAQLSKERLIRTKLDAIHSRLMGGINVIRRIIGAVKIDSTKLAEFFPLIFAILLETLKQHSTLTELEGVIENGWDIYAQIFNTILMLSSCLTGTLTGVNSSETYLTADCVPLILAAVVRKSVKDCICPPEWSQESLQSQIDRASEMLLSKPPPESTNDIIQMAIVHYLLPFMEIINQGQLLEELLDNFFAPRLLLMTSVKSFPLTGAVKLLLSIEEHWPKLSRKAGHLITKICGAVYDAIDDEINDSYKGTVKLLTDNLLHESLLIRQTCLQSLEYFTNDTCQEFNLGLLIVSNDSESEDNRALAQQLRQLNQLELEEWQADRLVALLEHPIDTIRKSVACALGQLVSKFECNMYERLMDEMMRLYVECLTLAAAPQDKKVLNSKGTVVYSSNQPKVDLKRLDDHRHGLALGMHHCASASANVSANASNASADTLLSADTLTARIFDFLLHNPAALADESQQVRREMRAVGEALIEKAGSCGAGQILALLERSIEDQKFKQPQEAERSDWIHEGCVVLTAACVRHLPPTDPRIPVIVDQVVELLRVPSESVQQSVAECLPALVKILPVEKSNQILSTLVTTLFNPSSGYGERRGAAYGVAAIVKGKGLTAMKECGVVDKIKQIAEDKHSSVGERQGAVFAVETLSHLLGRLFEPYVIQLLPCLLKLFGDSSASVRQSTEATCQVLMGNLSAHCVKLILPSLLAGLAPESKWRTKVGSVEMLATMAHCAPKQLSISLPAIIPRLVQAAITDSHTQVQQAASDALAKFTSVVKNAEIKQLSSTILLKALGDPTKYTEPALDALLRTSFTQLIDAPSLAIIVPIVERGMKERGAETKKKAVQIVGSMAELVENGKDFASHLAVLLPLMREVLVDPVPEPRAMAAKALGMLVEKLGEQYFPSLLGELVQMLKADSSTSVDRQGAAQALAEILLSLGVQRLDELLPDILQSTRSVRPTVRDGFMMLLIFLPLTFGGQFEPYLSDSIPCIFEGLADEYETVRTSSLRAARVLVERFTSQAVTLLLPTLEQGLFHENWRIRQSSTQLLGELLFRLAGLKTSETQPTDEEGEEAAADGSGELHQHESTVAKSRLIKALEGGLEHFNQILASLYVIRSDVNGVVRQTSVTVWKALVSNTPRTMKEIVPNMLPIIHKNISSRHPDHQHMAVETLQDLVQKLGVFFLSHAIPYFTGRSVTRDDSSSDDTAVNAAGACEALTAIIAASADDSIAAHESNIIPALHKAIVDQSAVVRRSCAKTIALLQHKLGQRVTAELLPALLGDLSDESGNKSVYALEALKELVGLRSGSATSFTTLLPLLLKRPINATALTALIPVMGLASIRQEASRIMEAVCRELRQVTGGDGKRWQELGESLEALFTQLNASEESGIEDLIKVLLGELGDLFRSHPRVAAFAFTQFCVSRQAHMPSPTSHTVDSDDSDDDSSSVDDSESAWFVDEWLARLLNTMKLADEETAQTLWEAVGALINTIPKDELCNHLESIYLLLKSTCTRLASQLQPPQQRLFGDLFKLKVIMPPLISALTVPGQQLECREYSAKALGILIANSSANGLKPLIMPLVGALIRVAGDKFPAELHCAVLKDITLLLDSSTGVGPFMRPFVPQLQRVIVKTLTEVDVGQQAALCETSLQALRGFIRLKPAFEPLARDFSKSIKSSLGCQVALWMVVGLHEGAPADAAERYLQCDDVLLTIIKDNTFPQHMADTLREAVDAVCTRNPPIRKLVQ